jgi:hypothetical protein
MEMTAMATELQTLIDTANTSIFNVDIAGLLNEWNEKVRVIIY